MVNVKSHSLLPTLFDRDEFLTPFDRLFDRVMFDSFPTFGNELGIDFFEKNAYPRINVTDHKDKVKIVAEVAGLDKENVGIDIEDNVLTISGEKQESNEEGNGEVRYIRRELKRSSFKRSFRLGDNMDSDNVNASFNNGILTVEIPKVEPDKPKKKFVKIS